MRIASWDQGIRWREFVNESDETMPAFGVGVLRSSVNGTVVSSVSRVIKGRTYLRVFKPDAAAERMQNPAMIVFNGPVAVPAGKTGSCTQDTPTLALRAFSDKPEIYANDRGYSVPGVAGRYVDHGEINGTLGDTLPQSNLAGPWAGEWCLRPGLAFSIVGPVREQNHDLCLVDGVQHSLRLFHDAHATGNPTSPVLQSTRIVAAGGELFAGTMTNTGSYPTIHYSYGETEHGNLLALLPLQDYTVLSNTADSSPNPRLFANFNPSVVDEYQTTNHQIVRDGLYWIDVAIVALSYFAYDSEEETYDYADDTAFTFRARVTAYEGGVAPSGAALDYPTNLVSLGAEDLEYNNPSGDVESDYTAVRSRYAFSGWLPLRSGWKLHVFNETNRPVQYAARWSVLHVGEIPANCDVPWSELLYR